MMTVQFTCPECGSSVHVFPNVAANQAECDICHHKFDVFFDKNHEAGKIEDCALCKRKDFYIQKDFNRKIGVALFLIASVLAIFTYGISFIVLYLVDFFLFRKLNYVAICYKCNTIYRNVENLKEIPVFNHEMHDRILYADHDFKGKPLQH